MTLETLLGLPQNELAAMSDAAWKEILSPYLPYSRPEQQAPARKAPTAAARQQITSKRKAPDANTNMRVLMRKMELKTAGKTQDEIVQILRTEFIQYDLGI